MTLTAQQTEIIRRLLDERNIAQRRLNDALILLGVQGEAELRTVIVKPHDADPS